MSSVPEKNDFLAKENGSVADDEMKSLVKNDSDNSLSSSIGLLSDGDGVEEEDGEEAQSKAVLEGSLNSLASLEAALPFKRGLSSSYNGKSRSFMNLGEVQCVEEVEKEESPLNKRRRLTMAQNTFYKWGSSSSSMPLLTRSDRENTHSVGAEQEFKSSTTTSTNFSSVNSTTKLFIN